MRKSVNKDSLKYTFLKAAKNFIRPTMLKLLIVLIMIILFALANIEILNENGFPFSNSKIGSFLFNGYYFTLQYIPTYLLFGDPFALLLKFYAVVAQTTHYGIEYPILDFIIVLLTAILYFYILTSIIVTIFSFVKKFINLKLKR